VTNEFKSTKVVAYKPEFAAALGGDVVATLVLSQIHYWYSLGANGKSKLRVYKKGQNWLVKSYPDFAAELQITQAQARRAIKVLRDRGIIDVEIYQFAGAPQTHISYHGVAAINGYLSTLNELKQIANKQKLVAA
jgi:hypothetical protein